MNDSIKGSFFFKGANKFFPSLLHALFHARDDVTISIAPGNLPTVKITPSGPQPYNRFCTFEAWQMPDGWSFVNYYTPGNSGMKNIIEETISFLIQRGYVFEEPPAVEAPQPDDQAGAPPRPKRRDVADRVRDVHAILKDGKTTPTAAFEKIGTDKTTYRRYCEGVTGEKPLG